MSYEQIFFLVEGPDDTRFVESVIKPLLQHGGRDIETYEYSVKPDTEIKNFIDSINCVDYRDYYFLIDEDLKWKLEKKFNFLDNEKVFLVIKEIESWYMAGIDKKSANEIGITYFNSTNKLDKSKFNQEIPNSYISRSRFLMDLLEQFEIVEAKKSNESFLEAAKNIPLNTG